MSSKTYIPDPNKIERKTFLIDAKDQILGKVAAKAAVILRGKHKVIFTRHLDTGDRVVIINAEKVKVTGKKLKDKIYQRFSGYPSGQKVLTLEELLAKAPTEPLRLAINHMLPQGPLGNKLRSKVRIYAGEKHPHTAQQPVALELNK